MCKLSFGGMVGAVAALATVVVLAGAPAMAQPSAGGSGSSQGGASKDMIDLRPKFKAGQDTKYKMTLSQTAKTKSKEIDAKDMGDEKTDQEIKFSLRVKSIAEDGTANVDLVYESVKMVGEVNGEPVSVDTTKPATTDKGDGAAGIRAMAGTTMSLVIDKDGNITKTSGGGGLMGGGMDSGGDLLGPIFSPGKAPGMVKKGQSWTHVDEIGMGDLMGPMRLVTTHTLESASNGEARIKVKGKIEPGEESPGAGKGKPATDMVKITKNDHNGAYVWDTERGQIKSFNTMMKSEIKVDMAGLDMTRSGDTTMKLERIGTEPVEKTVEKPKDKGEKDKGEKGDKGARPDSDADNKPKPKR